MTKNKPKKITDAKADSEGDITHVKIQGNQRFTPMKTAIKQAKRGEIDAVPVKATKTTKEHLRSRPNSKESDNLDDMAGDK
jgi:hypothetical protein